MDEQLRKLAEQIENSQLPDELKEDMYQKLVEGPQATVWPVLMQYVPGDKVAALANSQGEVAFEQYQALIMEAMKDGKAIEDMTKSAQAFLKEAESAMEEAGI